MQKIIFLLCILSFTPGIYPSGGSDSKKYLGKDTISISFVGDLMCHSPLFQYAETDSGGYNFKPYFEYISAELSRSDITIGNLETVIAGKDMKYTGYPDFNSPEEYLDAVKAAGIDFLVTANNHSLDRGEKGIYSTLDQIRKRGIGSTGTFNSLQDRDSLRIIKTKYASIAVLSYTYGTNGKPVPKGKEFIINRIDINLIRRDILRAKEAAADIVIVFYHFGDEYKKEPNSYQKNAVSKAIESGADLVIGSHPHVLQPGLWIQSDSGKQDKFVSYSLGNFISNQQWRYSDAGAILTIKISGSGEPGKYMPVSASYLPTWVFKGKIDNKMTYRILPSGKFNCKHEYLFLGKQHRELMRQAYFDSKTILTKYGSDGITIPEPECQD